MRIRVLACESLARLIYHAAAHSSNLVEVELVPRHFHQPAEIRGRLQSLIDAAEGLSYDAVVLGYGLCGNATTGLLARSIPLVIPRAHDCIALYLGSRARYNAEFAKEPGTYWYAQDYMERSNSTSQAMAMGTPLGEDTRLIYEIYVRKYGQKKADQLMEIMDEWMSHYKRAVYLDTGLSEDRAALDRAAADAAHRGWAFERLTADISLIQRLLDGVWDEDFLVTPPGQKIIMSPGDDILTCISV